jgi:hypothetical protein
MNTRRRELLERLNTLDAGPTEDDRRAEQEVRITKAVQTAEALARGRDARRPGCGASLVGLPTTVNALLRTPSWRSSQNFSSTH